MKNALPEYARSSTRISWVMMILSLGCLIVLALYIPPNRRGNMKLIREFKVEVPALTQWMLAIPDAAFPALATLAGIAVICIQWRGRGSIGSASFHMLMIVVCAAIFVMYREAIVQPAEAFLFNVSGPPRSR